MSYELRSGSAILIWCAICDEPIEVEGYELNAIQIPLLTMLISRHNRTEHSGNKGKKADQNKTGKDSEGQEDRKPLVPRTHSLRRLLSRRNQ